MSQDDISALKSLAANSLATVYVANLSQLTLVNSRLESGLKHRMRAWVEDQLSFYQYDVNSVVAHNGTTVIAPASAGSFGRWVIEELPAALQTEAIQGLVTATPTTLAAVTDANYATGKHAWVTVFGCDFVLDKTSTATADGITIVNALSSASGVSAGRWLRLTGTQEAKWLSQATWYIDPAGTSGGLDTNTGAVGVPLRTWAELERRYASTPKAKLAQNITIHVLTSWADDSDPITCDFMRQLDAKYVLVQGTATTVRSGTFTALTQTRDNTLNRFWRLADTAVTDWTADAGVSRRIRITSGAAVGAIAYVKKNVGAGVAEFSSFVLITTPYTVSPTQTEVSPIGDETYVVESLTACNPQMSGGIMSQSVTPDLANFIFENMSLGRSATPQPVSWSNVGPQVRLLSCVCPALIVAQDTTVNAFNVALNNVSGIQLSRGGSLRFDTGICRGTMTVTGGTSQVGSTNLHAVLLGTVSVSGGGVLAINGPVGVDVTGTAFSLSGLAGMTLEGSTSGLYGAATTYVLGVPAGCHVTGTSTAFDRCYAVGTTQDFWCGIQAATVNVIDDSVSPSLVVAAAQSFTNLRAATPTGLGYRCAPIRSNAFIGLST